MESRSNHPAPSSSSFSSSSSSSSSFSSLPHSQPHRLAHDGRSLPSPCPDEQLQRPRPARRRSPRRLPLDPRCPHLPRRQVAAKLAPAPTITRSPYPSSASSRIALCPVSSPPSCLAPPCGAPSGLALCRSLLPRLQQAPPAAPAVRRLQPPRPKPARPHAAPPSRLASLPLAVAQPPPPL